MHHHRLGGVNTAAVWVGIGASFGNPHMESILICRVTSTLNKILDTKSKLKTGGEAPSQELSVKEGNREKESVSIGGLIPHKYPLCFIEGTSVFTISRRTRRDLDDKELGQSYN